MMVKELHQLEKILESERILFSKYLEKLIEQQRQLIEKDLVGLRHSSEKIKLLAQDATRLESDRKDVIARISRKRSIGGNDVTLGNLLERFQGYDFAQLENLRAAILDTHAKAAAQRERNELLINQSMSAIMQTIIYLNEKNKPRAVYDKPSRKKGRAPRKRGLATRTT